MIQYTVNIDDDGTEWWYCKGQLHRDNGPAVLNKNGTQQWYKKGKLHRETGPAVIGIDTEEWWVSGRLHSEDGPALILFDKKGMLFEWYVNGIRYSESEWKKRLV